MKTYLKRFFQCAAVCCGVWMIIQRRVIAAMLTGSPLPELPEGHPKFCM